MTKKKSIIEQIKERYKRRKAEEVLGIITVLVGEYVETPPYYGDDTRLMGFLYFVGRKVKEGERLG